MKNKKYIYILLPAVLIVWGILGYRIFSAVQPNTTNTNLLVADVSFKPNAFKESEPFTIKANYRDPFLGTTKVKKPKTKGKVKVTPQPKQPFPEVTYKGIVSGNNNKQQVFIISMAGKQYFFKKYQTQQGVKLVKGNEEAITLRFQGQQQIFSLAK